MKINSKHNNGAKRVLSLILAALTVLACLLMGACSEETVTEPLRVAALKGPTGMGLAYLFENDDYSIELYDAPDSITGKFINGEIDIAAVPINLASVLYNKTEGEALLIGVNTLGVLYIVSTGDDVNSLADLSGKTLYATGEASTPQYVLEYLLEKNGLTGSVDVQYIAEHATLANMVAAGEADLAMLPEPNVSSVLLKNADAHIAIDLTARWDEVSDASMVQGCYIVRRSIVETNAKQVDEFLKDVAASVEKVNTDSDAPALIAELGIVGSAAIAEKALPQCNIVCLTDKEMRSAAEGMLTVLFNANPKSVGGALPGDDFYYEG